MFITLKMGARLPFRTGLPDAELVDRGRVVLLARPEYDARPIRLVWTVRAVLGTGRKAAASDGSAY